MILHIPVAAGEVIDKITILRLKRAHFTDPDQRANVERELRYLEGIAEETLPPLEDLTAALAEVNGALWEVEEVLRAFEQAGRFDQDFTEKARSVYLLNDRRAALKREINAATGSEIVEEKSYARCLNAP